MSAVAWPERVDHLGRIIPGRTVAELVSGSHHWSPREAQTILSRCLDKAARVEILRAAHRVGITHGPPDLAGRRTLLVA